MEEQWNTQQSEKRYSEDENVIGKLLERNNNNYEDDEGKDLIAKHQLKSGPLKCTKRTINYRYSCKLSPSPTPWSGIIIIVELFNIP